MIEVEIKKLYRKWVWQGKQRLTTTSQRRNGGYSLRTVYQTAAMAYEFGKDKKALE
jgi:hypothetical protein